MRSNGEAEAAYPREVSVSRRSPDPVTSRSGSEYRETRMLSRTRRRVLLVLAAVSIAGLLSMHGFDPVVTTVDQSHSSHSTEAGTGPTDHAAIGLCVFVVAVVSLGLASIRRLQGLTRGDPSVHRPRPSVQIWPRTASGPPLLHRLCVLRL